MFLFTQDPTCIIIHREKDFLIYYQLETEESWIIWGCCSQHGTCIDGSINSDNRPYEERLDCPVRPEIDCDGCDLRGEYL